MSSLNHTVDQMSDMKLHGMKDALLGQMEEPQYSSLTFEERLAHLIDAEVTERRNRRIKRMLSISKLKYKDAFIEDVDFHHSRGLDRKTILSLSNNDWVERHHNVIISGPTGTGKTYLACALAIRAITVGYFLPTTREYLICSLKQRLSVPMVVTCPGQLSYPGSKFSYLTTSGYLL